MYLDTLHAMLFAYCKSFEKHNDSKGREVKKDLGPILIQ